MIGLFFLFFWLVYLAVIVAFVAGAWKTFEKAGKPGWAAIIPIYNAMTMAEIVGRDQVFGILTIIPFVGLYFAVVLCLDMAKSFGKEVGFGVAMIFGVGWAMLGFGDATYRGPSVAPGTPMFPGQVTGPAPQPGYGQAPQPGYGQPAPGVPQQAPPPQPGGYPQPPSPQQ